MYLWMRCIHEQYTTDEWLQEIWHKHNSQKKAMNKSIMKYAPKDCEYSRTMSLNHRVLIALGVDLVGHYHFGMGVSLVLGLSQEIITKYFWKKQEECRQYMQRYCKRKKVKKCAGKQSR